MTTYSRLEISIRDHIETITMISSGHVNTMNIELADQLLSAFTQCSENEDVRAVILESKGKVFCAGGDLDELSECFAVPGYTLTPFVETLAKLVRQIRLCPKPVIAKVRGAAAGSGCNLALACDMVFAEEKAKFIEAFVSIGLAPDTGGAFLLPPVIGHVRAFEMLATGRPVKAEEAEMMGLISKAVPADQLDETVLEVTRRFAAGPSNAYRGIKEMLYVQAFGGYDAFMKMEISAQSRCERTDDYHEGVRSFLEKRRPVFKGL